MGQLVADPHPSGAFFPALRQLCAGQKGVVAHTVSSFGLTQDYHRPPSDDVEHIDFTHMEQAINSMVVPVKWLRIQISNRNAGRKKP